MLSPSTIEAVKDLAIDQVIGKYVTLKPMGSTQTLRAPSPFTEEKTPSFFVVANKGFFKCFSSGKGGDHITFVIEKFGLTYVDAIKMLCKDFGIEIKYEENGHPAEYYDKIELLYKINHATANRYAEQLKKIFDWPLDRSDDDQWRQEVFAELIDRRKFTHDTIVQWQIGFAPGHTGSDFTPDKWNFLSQTLVLKGYHEHGVELGLIQTKNGSNYDTFRNRIVYPIKDHHGRYVSFGGRSLKPDTYNPKYLNGNSSPIYDKSKVLYGLNYADAAIRKAGYVNLMEGYTDVISFHQAGITNTVGTCGTSLTEDQCKLLRKYTNKAVLFYDGDEAGQNASMRAIDLLMQQGFMTSIVPMPSLITTKVDPIPEDAQPQDLLKVNGRVNWNREPVFITHREKEAITCRTSDGEIELALADIATIEKIDPDELVRMLA